LLPALKWLAGVFSKRTGIQVAVEAKGAGCMTGKEGKTLLYRFVQEGLTNVARHARARSVRILIDRNGGRIRAIVQDDGIGTRPRRKRCRGLGLIGMRERIEWAGGTFHIDSRRGAGTMLVAEIPITRGADDGGWRVEQPGRDTGVKRLMPAANQAAAGAAAAGARA